LKRNLQIALGIAVGAGLLWLLFRDTDWAKVSESIRNANPIWLLLTQVPIWGSFLARVRRWHFIVGTAEPVKFRTLFTATQIGFLANFLLPLRAGELIRAFVLAQRARISFSRSVAFVAMDRVADLFGLAACMAFTLAAVPLVGTAVLPPGTLGNEEAIRFAPSFVRTAAGSAFLALVSVVVVIVLLYANQGLMLRLNDRVVGIVSTGFARRTHALLDQFAQGLHVLRSPRDMISAIGWSLIVWGCFVVSAVFCLEAFGLDYPWYTPFLLQVLLAVAVSVPGAPGFVGQFHLAFVVGILMAVPTALPAEAKAIAITAHLLNFVPTVVAGIISLVMEQSGLFELKRQSIRAENEATAEQVD
jgi:uncharacterized membrane protein YbhN (UPF0104 family)